MVSNTKSNVIEIFHFAAYRDDLGLLVIYLRGTNKDHGKLVDILIDEKFELRPITFEEWIDLQSKQHARLKCFLISDMEELQFFMKHFSK